MSYQEYFEKTKKWLSQLSIIAKSALILLVILLLAGGVFWINPVKTLRDMRNSQRRNDVMSILNAVYQYSVDHEGSQSEISSTPEMICRTKAASCQNMVDLSQVVADQKYQLSQIPIDPKEKDPNSSGYEISKTATGRINVTAPNAENAAISLSK